MTSDITLFEDDGSADRGFGWGRHDQSIFSILVNKLNYENYAKRYKKNPKKYLKYRKDYKLKMKKIMVIK